MGWSVMRTTKGILQGPLGEKYKEHIRTPSPIYDHVSTTSHPTRVDNFSIMGRESHNITRTIKEATFITVNDLSFDRNIGRFQLSHT